MLIYVFGTRLLIEIAFENTTTSAENMKAAYILKERMTIKTPRLCVTRKPGTFLLARHRSIREQKLKAVKK